MRFINKAYNIDRARQYFKQTLRVHQKVNPDYLTYVIIDHSTQTQSGIVGVTWHVPKQRDEVEVGVMILPEWRRRGIAHQAKTMLVNHLLQKKAVKKIHVFCQINNQAAMAANHKLGFTKGRIIKVKVGGETTQEWFVTGVIKTIR